MSCAIRSNGGFSAGPSRLSRPRAGGGRRESAPAGGETGKRCRPAPHRLFIVKGGQRGAFPIQESSARRKRPPRFSSRRRATSLGAPTAWLSVEAALSASTSTRWISGVLTNRSEKPSPESGWRACPEDGRVAAVLVGERVEYAEGPRPHPDREPGRGFRLVGDHVPRAGQGRSRPLLLLARLGFGVERKAHAESFRSPHDLPHVDR